MTFQPLDIDDYPRLEPFFANQPHALSVYSLPSLVAWSSPVYRTSFAFADGAVVLAAEQTRPPRDRHLLLPVSPNRLPTPAELRDLAKETSYSRFSFVPGPYLDLFGRDAVAACFDIFPQTAFDDYVYRKEDLAELKGNRYAKKRNLIHQFDRTYLQANRVCCEDLTPANRGECLAFLEEWCEARDCDLEENETLACEKMAVTKTLQHIERLVVRGLAIRLDGTVRAFGIASRLNDEVGILHFEKADAEVRGLYQYLDRECARRLFPGCLLINKESDMDLPELARSKRSYHPVFRVPSFRLDLRP